MVLWKTGKLKRNLERGKIMQNFSIPNLEILIPVFIWSLAWKGFALWRAARKSQKGWFVAILIVNSAGILEIIYLLTAGKQKSTEDQQVVNRL